MIPLRQIFRKGSLLGATRPLFLGRRARFRPFSRLAGVRRRRLAMDAISGNRIRPAAFWTCDRGRRLSLLREALVEDRFLATVLAILGCLRRRYLFFETSAAMRCRALCFSQS